MYIVAYVDDRLIVGLEDYVFTARGLIGKLFIVTDIGICSYFLGIKMDPINDGLF